MSLQSPCKIEFTPDGDDDAVLLLDVGGWLAATPRWEVEQGLFERDGILAANGYFAPLGGADVTLSFETETDMDSLAEALDAFARPEVIGGKNLLNVDGVLVITSDDQVTTYDPAVIGSITPKLPSGEVSSVSRAFSVRAAVPVITLTGDPS